MDSNRLSKIHTSVAQLLYIALAIVSIVWSRPAQAQATTPPATTAPGTAAPTSGLVIGQSHPVDDPDGRCLNASNQVTQAMSDINTGCNLGSSSARGRSSASLTSCTERIQACNSMESVGDDESDDDSSGNQCSRYMNTDCAQANAGNGNDYRDAKRTARESVTDAQSKVNELTQKAQEASTKNAQKIQELRDALAQAGLKLQDDQKAIQLQLQSDLQEIDSQKAQAVIAARQKMDSIDAQVVALNNQADTLQTAIANAENDRVTACRDFAEKAYNSDLQQLNQRIAAQDSTIRNLGSATTISGYTNRKARERAQAKNRSYAGHYTGCVNGIEGGGEAAKAKVVAATRAANDFAASKARQVALLQTQRAEAAADLKTATAQLDARAQLKVTTAQAQIESKVNAYNLLAQQTTANISAAQSAAQQEQQSYQTQIQQAQQNLQTAQTELTTASARSSCYERYGARFSATQANTQIQNLTRAQGAIGTLRSACGQLASCPARYANSDCSLTGSRTTAPSGTSSPSGASQ